MVMGRVEPGHLSVSESYSRHFAFAATVEIIGSAKRADSIHTGNEHLALAESYLDKLPEAKQNLETILECIPHPRRWLVFLLTTKPAEVRAFYTGADSWRVERHSHGL